MPAGYSGTPLVKKLGIKPGFRVYVRHPPQDYLELVKPIPESVTMLKRLVNDVDFIHFFVKQRRELEKQLPKYQAKMCQDGMIWISWPKKASKVPTDVTEDVIREVCLPMGLVDVKVCAVDEVWSGLKLVIRKELRQPAR